MNSLTIRRIFAAAALIAFWAACAEVPTGDEDLQQRAFDLGGPHYDFEEAFEVGYCADFTDPDATGKAPQALHDDWSQTFADPRPRPTWSQVVEGPHYDGRELVTGYDDEGQPIRSTVATRAPDWDYISNNFLLVDSLRTLASTLSSFAESVEAQDGASLVSGAASKLQGCELFDDVVGTCICGVTSGSGNMVPGCGPDQLGAPDEMLDALASQLDEFFSEVPARLTGIWTETLDSARDGEAPDAIGIRPALVWQEAFLGLDLPAPDGISPPEWLAWLTEDLDPVLLEDFNWTFADGETQAPLQAPKPLHVDTRAEANAWLDEVKSAAQDWRASFDAWLDDAHETDCPGLDARVDAVQSAADNVSTSFTTLGAGLVGEHAQVRSRLTQSRGVIASTFANVRGLIDDLRRVRLVIDVALAQEHLGQVRWVELAQELALLAERIQALVENYQEIEALVAELQLLAEGVLDEESVTEQVGRALRLLAASVDTEVRAFVDDAAACGAQASGASTPSEPFSFASCTLPGLEGSTSAPAPTQLCALLALDTASESALPGRIHQLHRRQLARHAEIMNASVDHVRDVLEGLEDSARARLDELVEELTDIVTTPENLFACTTRDTRCNCTTYCETFERQGQPVFDGVFFWGAVDYMEDTASAAGAQALFFLDQIGFLDDVVDFLVGDSGDGSDSPLAEAIDGALDLVGDGLVDIARTIERIARFFSEAFRYIDQFASGYHLGAYSELRPDLHMCIGWAGHGAMATFGEGSADEQGAFSLGARYGAHNLSRDQRVQYRSGGFALSARGLDLSILPTVELNKQVDGFRAFNPLRPLGLPIGLGAQAIDTLSANAAAFAYGTPGDNSRGTAFAAALTGSGEGAGFQIVRDLYPVRSASAAPGGDAGDALWPRLPAGLNLAATWDEVPAWEQRSVAVASFGLDFDLEIGRDQWNLPAILLFSTGAVDVRLRPWIAFSTGVGWQHEANAFLHRFADASSADLPADFRGTGLSYPADFGREMHAMQGPDVSADNRTEAFVRPEVGADLELVVGARLIELVLAATIGLAVDLSAGGWGGVLDMNAQLADILRLSNPDPDDDCTPVLTERFDDFCTDERWRACSTDDDCRSGRSCVTGAGCEGEACPRWCMPRCESDADCLTGRCRDEVCMPTAGYEGSAATLSCTPELPAGGSCGIFFQQPDTMEEGRFLCIDEFYGIDMGRCDNLSTLIEGEEVGEQNNLVADALLGIPFAESTIEQLRAWAAPQGRGEGEDGRLLFGALWSEDACGERGDEFDDAQWTTAWFPESGVTPCETRGLCTGVPEGPARHDLTESECMQLTRGIGTWRPYRCESAPIIGDEMVVGWEGPGCHPLQHGFDSACGCASDAGCASGERCQIGSDPETGEAYLRGHCVGAEDDRSISCLASDGPCPPGRVLAAGVCQLPCASNADCETGRVCAQAPELLGTGTQRMCRPEGGGFFAEELRAIVEEEKYPAHAITTYAMAEFRQQLLLGLGLSLDLKVRFVRNPFTIFDVRDYFDIASTWRGWYQPGLEARYHHECARGLELEAALGSDLHLYDIDFSPVTNFFPQAASVGSVGASANAALGAIGVGGDFLCGEGGVCRYMGDLDGSSVGRPDAVAPGNTGRTVGEFLDWCRETMPEQQEKEIEPNRPDQITTSVVETAEFGYDFTMDVWKNAQICIGDEPLFEFLGSLFVPGDGPPVNADGTPNLALDLSGVQCEYRGQYAERCATTGCRFPCDRVFDALSEVWGCLDLNPNDPVEGRILELAERPNHMRLLADDEFADSFWPHRGKPAASADMISPQSPAILRDSLFPGGSPVLDLDALFFGGEGGAEPYSLEDMAGTFRDLFYPVLDGDAVEDMPDQRSGWTGQPMWSILYRDIGRKWHEDFTRCMEGASTDPLEFACEEESGEERCSPVRLVIEEEVQLCPEEGGPGSSEREGESSEPSDGLFPPTGGACCTEFGGVRGCMEVAFEDDCVAVRGDFTPGASCSVEVCPGMIDDPLGACCRPDGYCVDAITEDMCAKEHGGTFTEGISCESCLCEVTLDPPGSGCASAGSGARGGGLLGLALLGLMLGLRRRRTSRRAHGLARLVLLIGAGGGILLMDAAPAHGADPVVCCVREGCVDNLDPETCEREGGVVDFGVRTCEDDGACQALPEGACCLRDRCVDANLDEAMDERVCLENEGVWTPDVDCRTHLCAPEPPPTGACCNNGICTIDVEESACDGEWSEGLACSEITCLPPPPPTGACCRDGVCTDDQTFYECDVYIGGDWAQGVSCSDPGFCAPPVQTGACCAVDGSCSEVAEGTCEGTFRAGRTCAETSCLQPPTLGACCGADGACAQTEATGCEGNWSAGQSCAAAACPQPAALGACCTDATCLDGVPEASCAGTWSEGGACDAAFCPQPAAEGACCTAQGCFEGETWSACIGRDGTFRAGRACGDFYCAGAQEVGACCTAGGCAPDVPEAACTGLGGTWHAGLACDLPETCDTNPRLGACCIAEGCEPAQSEEGCEALEGAWQPEQTCEVCPAAETLGACCTVAGCLPDLRADQCAERQGIWNEGRACEDAIRCPPGEEGACCGELPGTCSMATNLQGCVAAGGSWFDDETCESLDMCMPPAGACCTREGCLEGVRESFCEGVGGVFVQEAICDETECAPFPVTGACCLLDDGECVDGIESSECREFGRNTQFFEGLQCGQCDCRPPEPLADALCAQAGPGGAAAVLGPLLLLGLLRLRRRRDD